MGENYRPYVNLPPTTCERSTSHFDAFKDHAEPSGSSNTSLSNGSQTASVVFRSRSESTTPIRPEKNVSSKLYVASFEYVAKRDDELSLRPGATIRLITNDTNEEGWFKGEIDGKIGLFPSNYVFLLGEECDVKRFPASSLTLPPGVPVLDLCKIGEGSTATVHRMLLNGEKAALKRFLDYSPSPNTKNAQKVLKREAMTVSGLHHPNIVRLLGICLEQPYVGLVLELCEGGSLRSLYKGEQAISMRVLINWVSQIANGMEYLCQQNYIHGDLKADNVLVVEEVCKCPAQNRRGSPEWCPMCSRRPLDRLTLKITDFGGTKKMTGNTVARISCAGTYAWLAPEAFRDSQYSEATDVWSFGVVLWELLSKEEPYLGEVPIAVAFKVSQSGQGLAIDDEWPEKWKNIMQRCWAIEPDLRPKFSEIVTYFKEFEKDTHDTNISNVLEDQLRRVQTGIAHDIQHIYTKCSTDQKNQLYDLFKKLYDRPQTLSVPETSVRRAKKKQIQKSDIVHTREVKHLVSMQKAAEGSDINVKLSCDLVQGKLANGAAGTLPRRGERDVAALKTLSVSSPNLHELFDAINASGGGGTLRRQDAIRKRQQRPTAASIMAGHDVADDADFARIDSADELGSPAARQDKGTLAKMLSKFQRKAHKRDSREDEESTSRGSVSSRTSNSRLPIPMGQMGRGPAGVGFLDVTTRRRTASSVDCSNPDDVHSPITRNKVSPVDRSRRPPIMQSNAPESPVKDFSRPSKLNNNIPHHQHHPNYAKKSPVELDEPFPASPDSPHGALEAFIPFPKAKSTDNLNYEMLAPQPTPTNGHQNHQHPAYGRAKPMVLPTLVKQLPPDDEPTHYQMLDGRIHKIFGGGLAAPSGLPYQRGRSESCLASIAPPSQTAPPPPPSLPTLPPSTSTSSASSSSMLLQSQERDLFSDDPLPRMLANPQYIQCPKTGIVGVGVGTPKKNPIVRPSTLDFDCIGTPGSSGISTGGSSYSLISDPPDVPAPPPPLPPKIPTLLPTREVRL